MTNGITDRVTKAIQERNIEVLLAVLEEVDRALTGTCRFASGEYWRQFVTVDFERFFAMLDAGEDARNSVKLADEQSKFIIDSTKGVIALGIQCPDEVGDAYAATWEKIK